MKAFFITSCGGPEVMRYGDLPDPSPARGERVRGKIVLRTD
jgi:NADPH:quinone reductase-like Zn-dependent oxidoreductase